MPIRNLLTLFLVTAFCLACAIQARYLHYGGKVGQAIRMVEDYYINKVAPEDLYVAAMDGIVSKLDKFSDFIPPQRYEEFQATIEQHFGGIGILIEGPPSVQRLTVISPIPGTPAYKAGIQAGDIILEIDGQSTEGLEATKATGIMRGPVGSTVQLVLQRMDSAERISLMIPRADIEINSVYGDHIREDSSWDFFLEEDSRVAYMRISMFGERTVKEFKAALESVRDQAKAVIIDLRYNPGGVLPASVQMCDMLVDRGVIVRTKGRKRLFDNELSATPALALDKSIPIVVLVNGDSASASEIMAGCLQDLGRAKIAGTRTFGKGTVQQVFELENDNSALKFTTARFLRPSGKNIHRTDEMTESDEWGITPEAELNVPITDLEHIYLNRRWLMRGDPRSLLRGERPPEPPFAADRQLEAAVQYLWNSIGPAESQQLNNTTQPALVEATSVGLQELAK